MNLASPYLATLGPLELLGVLGSLFYILAFAAVQTRVLDGNSLTYTLANLIAASLVGISLTVEFNLASAVIQGCWIVLGLVGVSLHSYRFLRRAKSSPTALEAQQ